MVGPNSNLVKQAEPKARSCVSGPPLVPSFGGLVHVRNKRQEFLWVHPQFEGEY